MTEEIEVTCPHCSRPIKVTVYNKDCVTSEPGNKKYQVTTGTQMFQYITEQEWKEGK